MTGDRTVLGIGEALWDCFGAQRRPGGAPANVAFHAGQLGERAIICSRVGRDEPGDALLAHFRQRGLDTSRIQRDSEHPTGTVTVDATVADRPAYAIHENVAWDYLEYSDELAAVVATASAVCFGSLAQRSAVTRKTIERVLAAAEQALVVYDVNLRPPWYTPEVIESSLKRSHVVKLNHEEVGRVSELLSLDSADERQFARTLISRFGVRLVCVTRGSDGALAVDRHESVDIPGKKVSVTDAVGAGDAFTAALIHGLLREWTLVRTVRVANEVGALVASRAGAMPALRAEFAAIEAST